MSPARVFISHSHEDVGAAHALAAALENRGLSTWIAPRDIPGGAQYNEAIPVAIQGSGAVALILSRPAMESAHIQSEVSLAFANRSRMFVFAVDPSLDYASLPTGWKYFLALAQLKPYQSADESAAEIQATLGSPDAAAVAPLRESSELASEARTRVDLGEALTGLRAKPEIAELVGRVVALTGAVHEYVRASRYLSLRSHQGDPVAVYVNAAWLSLAMEPDRARSLMGRGIGTLERQHGRRHFVKVGASELSDPGTMAAVEEVVLDLLGYVPPATPSAAKPVGGILIGQVDDLTDVEFRPDTDRHLMVVSEESKLTRDFVTGLAHAIAAARPDATIYCVGGSFDLPEHRAVVVQRGAVDQLLDHLVVQPAGSVRECFLICADVRDISLTAKYRLKNEDLGPDCHLILGWQVDRDGKFNECEPCLDVMSRGAARLDLQRRTGSYRPAGSPRSEPAVRVASRLVSPAPGING